jgi:hypothetical protein
MGRRSSRRPDPRLVDARGRVALSRAARAALGVGPGDYVTFEVDPSGQVVLARLHISVVPGPAAARPGGSGTGGGGGPGR